MQWPATPLELSSPQRFRPPHCPWPACASHHPSPRTPFRFHRHGSFLRRCDHRRVPRFRCLLCHRTFSLQSFAFSYYLKRPELSFPLAAGINAGSAHRQLARSLRTSPNTVTRFMARLGRHCILLLCRALSRLPLIREPIVYDDFESFVGSQSSAFGMGTAVGKHSWFIYALQQAPHRGGGAKSPHRSAHPSTRFPRSARRRAMHNLLQLLQPWASPQRPVHLLTDGHPAYATALEHHPRQGSFQHCSYPNPRRGPKGSPRSPEALRRDQALFATDLLHKIIRHSQAHHRRETIAFARRLEAALERGFVLAVWRNFVKPRSERRPRDGTPAMRLRLTGRPWSWERVLSRRAFRHREELPEAWVEVYERCLRWPDPVRMKPLGLTNAA